MGSVGTRRGTKDTGLKVQFDESKAGSIYQSLPQQLRQNIKKNLELSDAMRENINSEKPVKMEDEWTTKLNKEKRKVITSYDNGRLFYTVKNGNKILLKNGTVEQAANQIAMFYKKVTNSK